MINKFQDQRRHKFEGTVERRYNRPGCNVPQCVVTCDALSCWIVLDIRYWLFRPTKYVTTKFCCVLTSKVLSNARLFTPNINFKTFSCYDPSVQSTVKAELNKTHDKKALKIWKSEVRISNHRLLLPYDHHCTTAAS